MNHYPQTLRNFLITCQCIHTTPAACLLILLLLSCSNTEYQRLEGGLNDERLTSARYNHFENGVLFPDLELGLNILWEASFKRGYAYKENLGFFVPGGLLILPNRENTPVMSKLSALPIQVKDNKLYVLFENSLIPVLGIVHSHPDAYALHMPSPRNDYQFCYLGLHSYVMDHLNLFDGYKNANEEEVFVRLDDRNNYSKMLSAIRNLSGNNSLIVDNPSLQDVDQAKIVAFNDALVH